MKKTIITFLLAFVFCNLYSEDPNDFNLTKVGQDIPEFSFTTLEGHSASISDYKGQTVLINFFATWCGPCRNELPHLQKEVYDKYKNNNDFVLLILGREHNWEEVNKFKK